VQLVSKIFNLCGHDPQTSQTDGQTTCDLKTALCTIVHGPVKTQRYIGVGHNRPRPSLLSLVDRYCCTCRPVRSLYRRQHIERHGNYVTADRVVVRRIYYSVFNIRSSFSYT